MDFNITHLFLVKNGLDKRFFPEESETQHHVDMAIHLASGSGAGGHYLFLGFRKTKNKWEGQNQKDDGKVDGKHFGYFFGLTCDEKSSYTGHGIILGNNHQKVQNTKINQS